ncbi:MAG: cupin domain-containing protein [Sandaracinaceae bacterium]|nr:cupin domain-containing protein [Sandaracinaceae bacterium]
MRSIAVLSLALLLTSCGGAAECPEPAPSASAGDEAAPELASPPAEVRALADAERRASPPGTAVVAMLARGNHAFLGRLEMEAGAAVPENSDDDEEYIHVLEGHGTVWIDGVESEVTPGATIFMPAGSVVRYQNGDERLVAIQVFAGPASADKYDRWTRVE